MKQLQYPIGECPKFASISPSNLKKWIADIEVFPEQIRLITEHLTLFQKQWVYRPEGWNIAQVVHHCADSHMNSFIRFKLALTEVNPTIRPYEEGRWALLSDGIDLDLSASLNLLEALHCKWVRLIKQLSAVELQMEFVHPATGNTISLAENVGVYAWHCRHHLAHVQQAIVHKGKF